MSRAYFISDLHLGHEGALKWARDYRVGNDVYESAEWIIKSINSVVGKRDKLYILGDVVMGGVHFFDYIDRIPCRKVLIQGNHDTEYSWVYEEHFDEVKPYEKYKGLWLSHMPIHEYDMVNTRVSGNIHGHLHQSRVEDRRYLNVSLEQCASIPFSLEEVRRYFETGEYPERNPILH